MNRPDVIVFSLPRSHESFSSTSLSLAKELSLSTRVFFINNPYTIKDLFLGRTDISVWSFLRNLVLSKRGPVTFDKDYPNLFISEAGVILPINHLSKGRLYNYFSRINNFLVNRIVRSVVNEYRLTDFLFINSFNPLFYYNYVPKGIKMSIYHCVDDITQSRYIAKHGSYLELQVLKKYDLVLTTSKKLTRYAATFSKNVKFLPNAADTDLFKKVLDDVIGTPSALEGVHGNVIGYIGNLDHRIDIDLLEFLVSHRGTEWTFLFVGPVGVEFRQSKLMKSSKVILTGPKRLNELPQYLKAMKCCIIPFLCNTLTASIYPLKLNEYLAGGKPVVSTNFSEDLLEFSKVISIASAKEEFYDMIVRELMEDGPDARQKRSIFASTNSWKSRADTFWSIIDNCAG
jgi:glycosyltransferase involved in cell wall biosynthesis